MYIYIYIYFFFFFETLNQINIYKCILYHIYFIPYITNQDHIACTFVQYIRSFQLFNIIHNKSSKEKQVKSLFFMIQQILLTKKQVNNITTQIYTHQAANKEQQNQTPNYTAQNIQVTPNTIIILNQITSYNSILSFFKDLYYQQTALQQYNFNQTTF